MLKENQRIFNITMVVLDVCICLVSMVLAFLFRFNVLDGGHDRIGILYYLRLMVLVIPFYFLIYQYFGLHDSFRSKGLVSEVGKIVQANVLGTVFIFVLVFFLKEVNISRMVIALFAAFNTLFSSVERFAIRKILRRLREKGYNLKRLLIVGWNEASGEFYDKILLNRSLGYDVCGYLSNQPESTGRRTLPYRGTFQDLASLLEEKEIDEVVISLDYDEFPALEEIIDTCEKEGVKSSLLPFYTKYLPTRPYIDVVEGLPLINLRRVPIDNLVNGFLKRSFDILVSFVGLVLLSPVLLVVAIGVKCSSPGPVIYQQTRIGRRKKEFTMYKFRSMSLENNADMTTWGTRQDHRRTGFGAFLRKYSIDELPQLGNVLKGDMSLVGPRPERPFFVEKFREEIPLYMMKHLVRPGITGWAQVNGWRGDTSIEERIKCDIYYIENWTFLFDIKILFLTIFKGIVNKSEDL